jgi:organic anion transporter 3A
LLCGLLLILVAVPFFSFPKTLFREKEKIRLMEKAQPVGNSRNHKLGEGNKKGDQTNDTGYGKDIKGKYYINWL